MRALLSILGLSLLAQGLLAPPRAEASRVRELVEIQGIRDNQLVAYGLVVGLNGTGDSQQARFTIQAIAASLRRLGMTLDPQLIRTKNVAAVMVTATLGPDANPGTRVDVTVSSMGDARSLLGGTLIQTPLVGADREVYAVAQGPVVIGGFSAQGGNGSSVSLNHVTVGRVPNGAIVERLVPMTGLQGDLIALSLNQPSFVTATRIAAAINAELGEDTARATNSGTVEVRVPEAYAENRVGLVAAIQQLDVRPDQPSRIVIDERTGTIVLGTGVQIGEVAIAQGGLTLEVSERFAVSQPQPFGEGATVVTQESEVRARVESLNLEGSEGAVAYVPPQANLADVVRALNALGAGPRDLIAIFQALRTAGALQADIEVTAPSEPSRFSDSTRARTSLSCVTTVAPSPKG
ncbi:MAG: flagellar basal body P-ring protein FlgI [Myxococcota bacterium]